MQTRGRGNVVQARGRDSLVRGGAVVVQGRGGGRGGTAVRGRGGRIGHAIWGGLAIQVKIHHFTSVCSLFSIIHFISHT